MGVNNFVSKAEFLKSCNNRKPNKFVVFMFNLFSIKNYNYWMFSLFFFSITLLIGSKLDVFLLKKISLYSIYAIMLIAFIRVFAGILNNIRILRICKDL